MPKNIVHILHNEKFTTPFWELINNNFDTKDHLFIYLPGVDEKKFPIPNADNVIKINASSNLYKNKLKLFAYLDKYCKKADKIILHSLLKQDLIRFLFFYRYHLEKSYWVMWGGDVYQRPLEKRTLLNILKRFINRYMAKVVKGNVGHCISYLKGDFEIAKKLYNTKAKYHECIMYPSNVYSDYEIQSKTRNVITVLVGNSADDSNNHEYIIDKLRKLETQNFNIICPLSYGPVKHANKIINLGKLAFDERFTPLSQFLTFKEYLEILATVDIAVFAHERQQAMGNIITLLGLGKKVYMRKDISTFSLFEDLNIKVFDIESLELKILDEFTKSRNMERVKKYFSEKTLILQWQQIFN
jgi:hypothetical protein